MPDKDVEALRCRDRLAQRVAARLGPDGLIAAPCESRVLESALAMRLLNAIRARPEAVVGLGRYLWTTLEQSPPDALQYAIGRAALGRRPSDTAALEAVARSAGEREGLLLRVMAAEVGAIDFPRLTPAAGARPDLEMTAVRALAAHHAGTPHAVSGNDWATLASACRPVPVGESNQSARLLALLALRTNPAYRPAVRRALPGLVAELRPDGGLPYIAGTDVRATAVAGMALVAARHPGPHAAVLADALAAQQNPDGGFGCHPGVARSEVLDTARCLEFLRSVAPGRHHGTITAAEEHLLTRREPAGGFTDPATTAAVAHALAANPVHRPAVERAVAFVAARQRPDGGFEGGSRSTPAVAFHAVQVLDRSRGARAVGFLRATQNRDGGFGQRRGEPSDPVSTAYAASVLSRFPGGGEDESDNDALRRALDHLVACRQPDGGYRGRPDQAAPGPLLYDVPALAESCVLLGLAHATAPAPTGDRTVLAATVPG